MKIEETLRGCALLASLAVAAAITGPAAADQKADRKMLEHGRYLIQVGGCNDCHTPGYPESGGQMPREQWLTGSPVGFSGPWGTTYPSNLRLTVNAMTEAQWLKRARSAMRPPMPGPSLNAMSDQDLRAVYRFIRGLGATGVPAPAYVPPDQVVVTPYIEFVPKRPAANRQAANR